MEWNGNENKLSSRLQYNFSLKSLKMIFFQILIFLKWLKLLKNLNLQSHFTSISDNNLTRLADLPIAALKLIVSVIFDTSNSIKPLYLSNSSAGYWKSSLPYSHVNK